MNEAYSARMDEAMNLTVSSFRGKFRKGTTIPYLTHLLAVAAMVGEGGGDEDQIIAALLHDWLEDIPGAQASLLEDKFGLRVRRLVEALSDTVVQPKPPWRERKERYIAHLYDEPPEVKLISVADKLHNCRSTVIDLRQSGIQIFERFNAKQGGTLWYYQALIPALAKDWDHWLLDLLRFEVNELVRLGR